MIDADSFSCTIHTRPQHRVLPHFATNGRGVTRRSCHAVFQPSDHSHWFLLYSCWISFVLEIYMYTMEKKEACFCIAKNCNTSIQIGNFLLTAIYNTIHWVHYILSPYWSKQGQSIFHWMGCHLTHSASVSNIVAFPVRPYLYYIV